MKYVKDSRRHPDGKAQWEAFEFQQIGPEEPVHLEISQNFENSFIKRLLKSITDWLTFFFKKLFIIS